MRKPHEIFFASHDNVNNFGFNQNKLEEIDKVINAEVKNGFPGAGLCVVRKNAIVKLSSYGYKLKYTPDGIPLDDPIPMMPDTLFDLASNTKMYATVFAVMHLVYEGLLNIETPVYIYIHRFANEKITVKDLLNHTAGYNADPILYSPEISRIHYSQSKEHTEKILIAGLPGNKSTHASGKPSYSDVDYMILGMIIERITKMQLDKYVESKIYAPLGLTHTVFNPLEKGFSRNDCAATEINGNTRGRTITFPNIRTKVIQGQVHDEKSFYSMGGVSGHAGLFSTLKDLAVLCQVMLNNGTYGHVRLWNKSIQDIFVAAHPLDHGYGLGWRRAQGANVPWFSRLASSRAVGHTGWVGTMTVIDPVKEMSIILLTNKKHSPFIDGEFTGDKFETGKYTKITTLVYEALL